MSTAKNHQFIIEQLLNQIHMYNVRYIAQIRVLIKQVFIIEMLIEYSFIRLLNQSTRNHKIIKP